MKKQTKKKTEKKLTIEEIRAKIQKQNSSVVVYEDDANSVRIPTRFHKLNQMLGGGIKKGGIIELFGFEDSGKTSLSLALAADIQARAPIGKQHVVMVNFEKSFDYEWWRQLGLDTDDAVFTHILPDDLEQGIGVLAELIESGAVCCAIIDSVYAAPARARKEMLTNWSKVGKGSGVALGVEAVKWGEAWTALTGKFHKYGTTVLAINQMREKIETGGAPKKAWVKPTTTPRGHALKFYAWIRLKITKGYLEDRDVDGIGVKIRVQKNKTSDDDKGVIEYPLYRGQGFDLLNDLIDLGEQCGFVQVGGGGFFKIGNEKIRGRANVVERLKNDTELLGELEKRIAAFVKTGEVIEN